MTDHGRAALRALHHGPSPLLLPNAWDVASARAFAAAGYPAVGTTSLGICAAAGLPDATRAALPQVEALARALAGLPCPVTVDLEDGYASTPGEVAALAAGLPVAGVNLEDSAGGTLTDPARLAAVVRAVKDACPDLFVNARVDTYWLGEDAAVATTLDRAWRYVDAGADGVFVPGPLPDADVAALAAALPVPLNVLPQPGRTVEALGALGVRRVSTGSLPYRAALHAALAAVRDVGRGTPAPALTYAAVQALTSDPLQPGEHRLAGAGEPDGA